MGVDLCGLCPWIWRAPISHTTHSNKPKKKRYGSYRLVEPIFVVSSVLPYDRRLLCGGLVGVDLTRLFAGER